MDYKYLRALLSWTRANKDQIRTFTAPSHLKTPQQRAAYELKMALLKFEKDFRGAKVLLGNDSGRRSTYAEDAEVLRASSSNVLVRMSSAALRCAQQAIPLLPELKGPLWSAFNDFLKLPALGVRGSMTYTLLKSNVFLLSDDLPTRVVLHREQNNFSLIVGPRFGYKASAGLQLSSANPAPTTVGEEVQYLEKCQAHLKARLETSLSQLLAQYARANAVAQEHRESFRKEQEQRAVETTRLNQVIDGIKALLSAEDQALLSKYPDLVRKAFEKTDA